MCTRWDLQVTSLWSKPPNKWAPVGECRWRIHTITSIITIITTTTTTTTVIITITPIMITTIITTIIITTTTTTIIIIINRKRCWRSGALSEASMSGAQSLAAALQRSPLIYQEAL